MKGEACKRLGLYLHIPFCRSKCLYCDFCSVPHPKTEDMARYVDRICEDLRARAQDCTAHEVDTVYLGGGTPTVLSTEELERILYTVRSHYRVREDAEITLECNPVTSERVDFSALRQAGYNRLSIGLQSAHEGELRALGRRHSFDGFCRTVFDAREAGFENISADVMFGIPGQSEESFLQTLEAMCALPLTHISAYGLTVEEGTPFDTLRERGKLVLPDEEETRRMYFSAVNALAEKGFVQYEISNFCKSEYQSRHNLKYWRCEEYLGFGPAAYSDFLGCRFGNSRDLAAYLEGRDITAEREYPDAAERENEYVMLGMRLCEGVGATAFEARFGTAFESRFGERLARYCKGGFVERRADGYAFTTEGMYVSNAILSDVLEF